MTGLQEPLRLPPSLAAHLAATPTHVIVTGAGGWFGAASLEMLGTALGSDFDARVTAFARSARTLTLRSGRSVAVRPLTDLVGLPRPHGRLCILHYAFLTREKTQDMAASAYVETNRAITSLVATAAWRLRAEGFFSTSSGAVYRPDGSLDDDLMRNPYGVLKREEENVVLGLAEVGVAAAACRVFNVAGPLINKDYAIGSLIRDALFEPAMTIRARHRVVRSFAHVRDIVAVGLAMASGLVQRPAHAFDTAGDEAVEVGALAERVRQVLGCASKPIVRGVMSGMPEDRYVGDGRRFAALATVADIPLATLDVQIQDTAQFLAGRPRPAESHSE